LISENKSFKSSRFLMYNNIQDLDKDKDSNKLRSLNFNNASNIKTINKTKNTNTIYNDKEYNEKSKKPIKKFSNKTNNTSHNSSDIRKSILFSDKSSTQASLSNFCNIKKPFYDCDNIDDFGNPCIDINKINKISSKSDNAYEVDGEINENIEENEKFINTRISIITDNENNDNNNFMINPFSNNDNNGNINDMINKLNFNQIDEVVDSEASKRLSSISFNKKASDEVPSLKFDRTTSNSFVFDYEKCERKDSKDKDLKDSSKNELKFLKFNYLDSSQSSESYSKITKNILNANSVNSNCNSNSNSNSNSNPNKDIKSFRKSIETSQKSQSLKSILDSSLRTSNVISCEVEEVVEVNESIITANSLELEIN